MSKPRLPGRARFLAFGCTHCPLQDEEAVDWLLTQITDWRPHLIVHLGDMHEANSASRWPDSKEVTWSLEDEMLSLNGLLKRVRAEAMRQTRLCYTPGNHDFNLLAVARIDKQIRGLCDWRRRQYSEDDVWLNEELKRHWECKCQYLNSRAAGVFRVGQVTFSHGYEANVSADEFQSIKLGVPYGLWIGAHTHKPVRVTQAMKTKTCPLPWWYANAGCMRDLKPRYAERLDTNQWGHACVVGEVDTTCNTGSRLAAERRWAAETRVFRLYADGLPS